ncbi:MAG: iron chelate uptake ABC transporter family permease subunit, partial [Clostridia bacterium]|nr:iron chelate uptake ABC transporter family permease subunit [Clostridia bacterium]
MKKSTATARVAVMFALLVFAFGAALVLNVNTGSLSIAPGQIFKIILHGGADGTPAGNVIWKIRLPRLLAAAVLGGALSVSGFLLQTFFRNPIAGPYVLGISSGAKMLVGIAMIFLLRRLSGVPFWVMMAAAFL